MECAEYARPSRRPLGGILLRDKPLEKCWGAECGSFGLHAFSFSPIAYAWFVFHAFFFARIFFLSIFPCMNFFPFSRPSPLLPHHFSNGPSVPNCRHSVQVIWRTGLKSPPPKLQRVSETCHEVRCVFFFVFKGDQGPAGLTGPAVSRDTSRQLIVVVLRRPKN